MANPIGSVVSLWRYPVKSMRGEEIEASRVTEVGLFGDRLYALRDAEDGKVATAKNPRKWPSLFSFGAALVEDPAGQAPRVRITLPDGSVVASDDAGIDRTLTAALAREVSLERAERGHTRGSSEEYWPDMEGLDNRDTVTDFTLPEGMFFDAAPILLLTGATLGRLAEIYPEGRFDTRRFRPNVVVPPARPGRLSSAARSISDSTASMNSRPSASWRFSYHRAAAMYSSRANS